MKKGGRCWQRRGEGEIKWKKKEKRKINRAVLESEGCCSTIKSTYLVPEWQWSSTNNSDRDINMDADASTQTYTNVYNRHHTNIHQYHQGHTVQTAVPHQHEYNSRTNKTPIMYDHDEPVVPCCLYQCLRMCNGQSLSKGINSTSVTFA